jgi:hypothetical protein
VKRAALPSPAAILEFSEGWTASTNVNQIVRKK